MMTLAKRSGAGFATSLLLLIGTGAAAANPAQMGKPMVTVVDPMGSDPVLLGDAEARKTLWQHHVVFSPSKGGTARFEIGYNNYLKDFSVSSPYAFKTSDGLCFIPTGVMEVSSDGIMVKTAPRTVAWRPAGAMTEHFVIAQDTITICAISPARDKNNKAQLGRAELPRYSGDMALQPRMHYYAVDFIPAEAVGAGDMVQRRRLVSRQKDGSTKMELTNFALKAGARLPNPQPEGEQVCWLETGQMELKTAGNILPVKSRNFFLRPEGAAVDELRAISDSSLICWTSPVGS